MAKRARRITPPNARKLATTTTTTVKEEESLNISAHPLKRTRKDTKFLPNKIATFENAAKVDKHTPLAKLTDAMSHVVKTGKGEASDELKEFLRDDKNGEYAKLYKEARKETVSNRAEAVRGCTTCGLSAERAGVPALLACQKCKANGRSVYYCSR